MSNKVNMVEALAKLILQIDPKLAFTILEIGALPLEGSPEPFYCLVDYFPASKIVAFEVDQMLCDDLNLKSKDNIRYYCNALGGKTEKRNFYNTRHPMCSSLYKPNDKLLQLYNGMDVVDLETIEPIETIGLDEFVNQNNIGDIDFIKMDIQGAELEVLQGGEASLHSVCAILSEVEFIPLYENQPLFGEICKYLNDHDISFHHFLGIAGRALKPLILNNNVNHPSQHMWSDAFFIKDLTKVEKMKDQELLKLAVMCAVYNIPDVIVFCLNHYDQRKGTNLQNQFMSLFN
ncbi:MAG: FkbM family methyltransferase [Candidatus Cloacimonetes bacterium]|nr:FkbM family methyltransferase [Candidatus Cloacimonadota bacterium]